MEKEAVKEPRHRARELLLKGTLGDVEYMDIKKEAENNLEIGS
ncbi:hypothetical protein ACS5PU_18445 [Pedobacter sp. GSP4]